MKKEEILEKSREENKKQDEMERDAMAKAGYRACAVGGAVCALVIFLSTFFSGNPNFDVWTVYLSMTGTTLLVRFIRMKRKRELVFAILQLLLATAFFVLYVLSLVNGYGK